MPITEEAHEKETLLVVAKTNQSTNRKIHIKVSRLILTDQARVTEQTIQAMLDYVESLKVLTQSLAKFQRRRKISKVIIEFHACFPISEVSVNVLKFNLKTKNSSTIETSRNFRTRLKSSKSDVLLCMKKKLNVRNSFFKISLKKISLFLDLTNSLLGFKLYSLNSRIIQKKH